MVSFDIHLNACGANQHGHRGLGWYLEKDSSYHRQLKRQSGSSHRFLGKFCGAHPHKSAIFLCPRKVSLCKEKKKKGGVQKRTVRITCTGQWYEGKKGGVHLWIGRTKWASWLSSVDILDPLDRGRFLCWCSHGSQMSRHEQVFYSIFLVRKYGDQALGCNFST